MKRTHTAIVFREMNLRVIFIRMRPLFFRLPPMPCRIRSTILRSAAAAMVSINYNRTANPNRDSLSAAISLMEDGEVSAVMASGWQQSQRHCWSLLRQGDHLVVNGSYLRRNHRTGLI